MFNAWSHRDYQSNSAVYVKQYPDRIVIENPGGFIDGITESNIISHPSAPRNKLIAETVQKSLEDTKKSFLEEPKSVIGKLVSGAWKKFKTWWDEKKRPEVEEKTRASVRDKLASFKKQSEETKHDRPEPTKRRGMDIE